MEKLIDRIKKHEGYRDFIYLDSEGYPTCGWGHHLRLGSKVPIEASEAFLKYDIESAVNDFWRLRDVFGDDVILSLNKVRREVIIEMIFNLGLPNVLKFKRMWNCIKNKNWNGASLEMLDSKWHTQVGKRARSLAYLMKIG